MPDIAAHRGHVERTKQARAHLDTRIDDWPEWVVVTAFYEALHVVESMLATHGIHCPNHEDRNLLLQQRFPRVWDYYGRLYKESRVARYFGHRAVPYRDHMPVQRIRSEIVGHWLARVRSDASAAAVAPPTARA